MRNLRDNCFFLTIINDNYKNVFKFLLSTTHEFLLNFD